MKMIMLSAVLWIGVTLCHPAFAQPLADAALSKLKSPRGVCAILGGDADLAMKVAEGSELIVFVQLADDSAVSVLKKAASEKGLLNTRLYVEKGDSEKCFLAENSVDLLVCANGKTLSSEMERVVVPLGSAVIAGENGIKTWEKPFPKEMDNWSYWYHRPDNNPVSTDSALKWPFQTQWLGKPYFGSQPRTTVIHNGINFSATGSSDGGHQAVAEMILNANLLEARSAFNGQLLWQRKLPKNYYTSRSAFVATDDAFYMIDDGKGVLALDPYTGKEIKRLSLEGAPLNYKWIAIQDGVLFALVGEPDLDPGESGSILLYKYPAPLISVFKEGEPRKIWGFGTQMGAYDLKSGKTLWVYTAGGLVSSRYMAIANGKLYFAGDEAGAGALDVRTGAPVWVNDSAELKAALKLFPVDEMRKSLSSSSIGNTRPGTLATPDILILQTKDLEKTLALSAQDGRVLWTVGASRREGFLHPFMMGEKIVAVAGGGAAEIDRTTGKSGAIVFKGGDGCGPITVSPNGAYRRHSIFWDRAGSREVNDHTFRSGCWQDAIPANGILLNTPYVCSCNYSLQGMIAQCSAGDFKFGQAAVEKERLETGKATAGSLKAVATDWFTHRANNQRASFVGVTVAETGGAELWSCKPEQKQAVTTPVAVGDYVFFADEAGRVVCLKANDGGRHWSYATGGKIFFSPTVVDGRVFVSSSDGYAYCLNSDTGQMIWRFRCAPEERRIMVYGALSSTWPANTGVLVQEGVAYVGAGITSQGGTHIYALDAATGKMIWQNNSSGHMDKENLAGAAIAGCFTISQKHLWLAGGNAASPVAYDLSTGVHQAPDKVAKVVSAKWQHSRGNEVANCGDRFILTGGTILFSEQPRRDVKAGLDNSFIPFNPQTGKLMYPEITPTSGRQTLPVWDDQQLFIPVSARNMIEGWRFPETMTHLQAISTNFVPNKNLKDAKSVYEPLSLIKKLIATEYPMKQWGPLEVTADAMALAENALVVVNQKAPGGQGKIRPQKKKGTDVEPELPGGAWFVSVYSRADGKLKWENRLASEPVDGGVCLDRNGQIIISFLDGTVAAFGSRK